MSADQLAKARQEWRQLKAVEKDFFHEQQFLGEQVRAAQHESMVARLQFWFLVAMLALVVSFCYFCSR